MAGLPPTLPRYTHPPLPVHTLPSAPPTSPCPQDAIWFVRLSHLISHRVDVDQGGLKKEHVASNLSRVCVYYSSSYEPFQFFYLFTAVFSTPTAPVLAALFVVGWTSDCVRWTFVLPLRGQNHPLLFRVFIFLCVVLCLSWLTSSTRPGGQRSHGWNAGQGLTSRGILEDNIF